VETTKRNLYLIGAGELAREIESWISLDKEFSRKWEIAGFLDKNLNAVDNYPSDYRVVGIPESFNFQNGDAAIVCIANPSIKKRILDKIESKVEIISYISPYSIVAKFVKIGKGVVVCPQCVISTNTVLADYVIVNCGSLIGHDCIVGEYSSLMANVDLGGHVEIGNNAFLGTKSTIIPGRKISDDITIGAGSVVMRNLKNPGTYYGNPATLLKF
jgi:sugar O-acyltransferase (sialic acid O-acetyltransferase NeuD family)